MSEQGQVTGTFNYVGQGHDEAVYFKNQPGANVNFESHAMPVSDMRRFDPPPSLEKEGFMIGRLPLTVGEELDPDAIEAIYTPLLHRYLADLTGAAKILIKKPIVRWSDRAPNADHPNLTASRYVHCDFDKNAFHQTARDLLADDPDKERWLSGRYAIIQTWRALSPPPQDTPLAVIDRRTLRPDDLVRAGFVLGEPGREQRFENFAFRHSSDHRWAYISNMTNDDLLLFMGFDSADEEMTGSPHSSFEYWRHCEKTSPRRSCEVRAVAYWG